jgi:hypothetical protein
MKKNVGGYYRVAMAMMILVFCVVGCFAPKDDVQFARQLMTQMIQGRFSARKQIDWNVLQFAGLDIAKEYKKEKPDQRILFERLFIANFSTGYLQQGASISAFYNWQMIPEPTGLPKGVRAVSANLHDDNTRMIFIIDRRSGRPKLIEIRLAYKEGTLDANAQAGGGQQ